MLNILPQLIVNGLIAGSIYVLVSLGLTMIFGVLGFINFAQGEFASAGAYTFFTFYILLGWPLVLSILLAAAVTGLLAICVDRYTFRPVRKESPLVPLIISVGISFIISSVIQMIFGANIQSVHGDSIAHVFHIGSITITTPQVAIMIVAAVLVVALYFFLKKTRLGKAMRAVADNHEVAEILGIDVDRIVAAIFFLGASLAAIGGSLIAFERNLYPTMGLTLNIAAFASVVLGGVGSIPGAVVGGLLYGLAENVIVGIELPKSWCQAFTSDTVISCSLSSGYKVAVAFVVLIIMLLVRPQGIMGARGSEEVRA